MTAGAERRRPGARLGGVLLLLGLAGLVLAFAFAERPFRGPDEADHYVRTLGMAGGDPIGRARGYEDAGLDPVQLAWVVQSARELEVPRRLVRGGPGCGSCLVPAVTSIGTYQPLPYLAPAAVVEAAGGPAAGNRLARVVSGAVVVALLGLAGALAWSPRDGPLALAGLFAVTTPMVLYIAGVLNGSGLEIAASTAFTLGLLRLGREGGAARWVWASVAAAGAAGALSRSTGPLWVVLALAGVLALGGPVGARRLVRESPRAALLTTAAVLAAIVANLTWERAHGPDLPLDLSPWSESVDVALRDFGPVLRSAVGTFGALTTSLPVGVVLLWAVVALAGLLAALGVGAARERVVLGASVLLALLVPLVFSAAFLRNTGFGLQGRHVLPALGLPLLLAGEVLRRRRGGRAAARSAALGGMLLLLGLQAAAFYVLARSAAAASEGPWFLEATRYSPAGGWWPWLALAGGSVAAAAAGAALVGRAAPAASSSTPA